ncbi:MAG: hypothetical protein CMA27_00460 [Euryarchaeota archaeon]|nr:hypothetical protein [Euryarchaeota archaeon]
MITFILFICNLTVVSVSSETENDSNRNAIFGGIVIDPNENFSSSINTKDASSVAHIFTATWCTPCVEVEHAIEDVANETNVTMLTFHRFAGETEDPFGSENAENWWKEWFNEERPLQPTAIINGGDSLIGASQGSYDNLYSKALEKPLLESKDQTQDSMIHTFFEQDSSEFSWEVLDVDGCEDVKTFINFVEDIAYFPNGSNGLKNYTHIVHHVKEISGGSGTADISHELSEIKSYDGDDLKLVITFGCMNPPNDSNDSNSTEESKDSSGLPFIGLIPTIMSILVASMIISRRNYFESIN